MASLYRRSKKRFSTSRAAWKDIAKRANLKGAKGIRSEHTKTHYVWRRRL